MTTRTGIWKCCATARSEIFVTPRTNGGRQGAVVETFHKCRACGKTRARPFRNQMLTRCQICLHDFNWKLARCPSCHRKNRNRPSNLAWRIVATVVSIALSAFIIYRVLMAAAMNTEPPRPAPAQEASRDVQFSR
jgi:hypothetical protein